MGLFKKADTWEDEMSADDLEAELERQLKQLESEDLPSDYEACGDCGFDHGYETELAYKWHKENPGSYKGIVGHPDNDIEVEEDMHSVDLEYDSDSATDEYGDLNDVGGFGEAWDHNSAKDSKSEDEDEDEDEDIEVEEKEENSGEEKPGPDQEVIVTVMEEGHVPQMFRFDLGVLPGSDVSEDEISADEEDEEKEDVQVEEKDMWDWQAHGIENFIPWLHGMFQNIPKHSGYDTSGIERVISWLAALDKCISRAVRSDLKGVLNVKKVEEARHSINDGILRSEERLNKLKKGKGKKKKAETESDEAIIKQAQKTGVSGKGVLVTVPLLISRIARVCINGTVSAGHDIEDLFERQVKYYDLDKREQAEVLQLLEDMGYPALRDRGFGLDQDFARNKENGMDWNQNFYA